VPSRRADATGQLTGGAYGRELQAQQDQAPFNALMKGYGLFNGIPTEFGNFGTPKQVIKTGGGLGGILGTVGTIASAVTGNPMFAMAGNAVGGGGSGGLGSILGSLGGNFFGGPWGGGLSNPANVGFVGNNNGITWS
jgi:hypothetical protein